MAPVPGIDARRRTEPDLDRVREEMERLEEGDEAERATPPEPEEPDEQDGEGE